MQIKADNIDLANIEKLQITTKNGEVIVIEEAENGVVHMIKGESRTLLISHECEK